MDRRALFFSLLATLLLAGAEEVCGQISNSEASSKWIARLIAADTGGTEDQYLDYSRSLAKTLGMFSAQKQEEILGFLPPANGAETADTGGSDGGSNYANPSEAISDSDLDSLGLLSYLLDQIPLSSSDLTSVLERSPAMEGEHLKDLLLVNSPLSNGFLISSLSNSKDNLSSENLKDILIANSPVKKVVLGKIASTRKMTSTDKAAVLAAQ